MTIRGRSVTHNFVLFYTMHWLIGKVAGIERRNGKEGPLPFSIITKSSMSEVCVIRIYYNGTNKRSIWVPRSIPPYTVTHFEAFFS